LLNIFLLEGESAEKIIKRKILKDEIELMLKLNKKAEQQALAKYGLDFVTDKYLPEKLTELGVLK
jgi:DNA topoisomerase-6 subunit A